MTIGDVLAVVAAVVAVGLCWAATLLLTALAFPERARRAGEAVTSAPGRCLARGAGVFFVVGVLAFALMHSPAGPVRLVGDVAWGVLALFAAVGSAGIARLLGERVQAVGTHMTPFAALTRGTALYVLAGFLPVVGWFLIVPLALLFSLGGAVAALRPARRATPTIAEPEPNRPTLSPSELGIGGAA